MNIKAGKILKITGWVVAIIIYIVVALLLLLYNPFVQDYIKDLAAIHLESKGWEVNIDKVRLTFPLGLEVDNALIIDENKDTLLVADLLKTEVSLKPLLSQKIELNETILDGGYYHMVTSDSAMLLNGKIKSLVLENVSVDLNDNTITLHKGDIDGGDVKMFLDNEKSKDEEESEEFWKINVNELNLSNLHYSMQMLPLISDLDLNVKSGKLRKAAIDTKACTVDADYLDFDGLDAAYFTPSFEYLASHPIKETQDTIDAKAKDWTITTDVVSLKNLSGIYAVMGEKPMQGIDFNYLKVQDVDIEIADLYNKGTELKIPLKKIKASERCGFAILDGKGTFEMDSTHISVKDFNLITENSNIKIDCNIDNKIFENFNKGHFELLTKSNISAADLLKLYPAMRNTYIPSGVNSVAIDGNVKGSLADLNIDKLKVDFSGIGDLEMKGRVRNMLSNNLDAHLSLDGHFTNLNKLKPLMGDGMQNSIYFPVFSIQGDADINASDYAADLSVQTKSGVLNLVGNVNLGKQIFDIGFDSEKFPVNEFVPSLGLGDVSLAMNASGHGFNILSPDCSFNCDLSLTDMVYKNSSIKNISSNAKLENGVLDFFIDSDNEYLSFYTALKSSFVDGALEYSFNSDFRNVDLYEAGLTDESFSLMGQFVSSGVIDLFDESYNCVALIDDVEFNTDAMSLNIPSATASFLANSDSLAVDFNEGDFNTNINASCSIDTLIYRFGNITEIISKQIDKKMLNFGDINQELPPLDFVMKMRKNNFIISYLNDTGVDFDCIDLKFNRDSLLNLKADVLGLKIFTTNIDTLHINANQEGDSLKYFAHIGNISDNVEKFINFDASGYVGSNNLQALYEQRDIKGKTSLKVGARANLKDEILRVNFLPEHPVIGYRTWNLSSDNFMKFTPAKGYVDADVKLSGENGAVSLITYHSADSLQRTIKVNVDSLKLGEWMKLGDWMPAASYAPKLKGEVNAEATFSYLNKAYKGTGYVGLKDFSYNKTKMGNLEFDLDMDVNPKTKQNEAKASFMVEGRKAMVMRGVVNDSVTNRLLNFNLKLNRLPMSLVNPFLPKNMAAMGGYLNGDMSMFKTDTISKLTFDGFISCDSTKLKMPMFGSNLKFSPNPIEVDSNKIVFKDFGVSGANDSPMLLNGCIDINNFASPEIDLNLKGKNVKVIDSKHTAKSQVFGKGFVNVNATAKGRMDQLEVDADLTILPETDVTYVLQTDVSAVSQQQQVEGLVKFVNFNDTIVKDSVPPESLFDMDLDLNLNILHGSILNVNLSPEGKNKVELRGNGSLTYTMNSLGDSRLSGRYTLNDGFVRYYPPLISEKYFKFIPGSFVSWTGDMMNPTLSLKATSKQTSTVVSEGSNPSRVNFLITASVTNNLNDMNVSFDLASNNSMVDSELKSMTPSQRSTQAINLMLYNNYTGNNSSTASAPNTNMLYSVLSSRLNNLASSVVKGVDISFGINEYNMNDGSHGGTGMNYSYQISKSLFNNRFKMTVGGNYDTGSTNSGSDVAQNLFNNVSFEYNLNASGNMSIKIYNKLTDNNIYQTQVNESGIGFVMRRRLMTLKDLFRFNFVNMYKNKENEQKTENAEEVDEKK